MLLTLCFILYFYCLSANNFLSLQYYPIWDPWALFSKFLLTFKQIMGFPCIRRLKVFIFQLFNFFNFFNFFNYF